MAKKKTIVTIKNIDVDLWWAAKALANSRKITLQVLITDLLIQAIDNNSDILDLGNLR